MFFKIRIVAENEERDWKIEALEADSESENEDLWLGKKKKKKKIETKTNNNTKKKRGPPKQDADEHPTCPVCLKVLNGRWRLKSHMEIHTDVRQFVCEICAADFKTKANLKTHTREVHQRVVEDVSCSFCGEKFSRKRNLQSHILKKHKAAECRKCQLTFQTGYELEKHRWKEHNTQAFCEICGKVFQGKEMLSCYHLLIILFLQVEPV